QLVTARRLPARLDADCTRVADLPEHTKEPGVVRGHSLARRAAIRVRDVRMQEAAARRPHPLEAFVLHRDMIEVREHVYACQIACAVELISLRDGVEDVGLSRIQWLDDDADILLRALGLHMFEERLQLIERGGTVETFRDGARAATAKNADAHA